MLPSDIVLEYVGEIMADIKRHRELDNEGMGWQLSNRLQAACIIHDRLHQAEMAELRCREVRCLRCKDSA